MTIEELKKRFVVKTEKPTPEDFNTFKIIEPYIDDEIYYIYFKNNAEFKLFHYLESSQNYKSKEELFGIDTEQTEIYIQNPETKTIKYIQKKLPKKWVISDKKIKREIDVFITNVNDENKQLLHTLYMKTRKK